LNDKIIKAWDEHTCDLEDEGVWGDQESVYDSSHADENAKDPGFFN
jgi:hypothetical protein